VWLQAVFFKMRVAGVLHIFQFETRQGEDICTALQTHINDIMMKRYSKAKQNSNGDRALPQANFGPKYEQHVNTIQKTLEETKQKLVEKENVVSQLTYERVRSRRAAVPTCMMVTEDTAVQQSVRAAGLSTSASIR
jgi:hypothetical protein